MFGTMATGATGESLFMTQGSTTVVEAVSRLKGVAPTELSPQLYQAIDPDALDALLETDSAQITFTYAGYRVTVEGNGDIHAVPVISHFTNSTG